ncbi:signal peptidase I [bacterium]|nr:signal peptidase I [candidate division CSSED10-310 bacterium]
MRVVVVDGIAQHPRLTWILWWVVMALALLLLIEALALQPLRVISDSMAPVVPAGRIVWLWKLAYGIRLPLTRIYLVRFAEPGRGDIVAVRYYAQEPGSLGREIRWELARMLRSDRVPVHVLVKRVVGLPGDVVEIRDKKVYINEDLWEVDPGGAAPGASLPAFFSERDALAPTEIPENRLFLLGDNRDASWDSRSGVLYDRAWVLGKVLCTEVKGSGQVWWRMGLSTMKR